MLDLIRDFKFTDIILQTRILIFFQKWMGVEKYREGEFEQFGKYKSNKYIYTYKLYTPVPFFFLFLCYMLFLIFEIQSRGWGLHH